MGKKKTKKKNWIQKAIKHPGALKRWLKKNRAKIKKLTGYDPFTKTGEVNQKALLALRKTKFYQRLSPTIKRRINLAITLEKMRRD